MNNGLMMVLSKEDKEIENIVKAYYAQRTGDREWEVRIDPSIIGGFIIYDGDYVYDSSVQGQLNSIKRSLLNE